MLHHLRVLIIGGDTRQIEVINTLATREVQLLVTGFDQIQLENNNRISKVDLQTCDFSKLDAIILPISGLDEGGVVHAPFSNCIITLTKEMLDKTPSHCVIYTGISTSTLDKLAHTTNKNLVKLTNRDDVAILNSIPTAEGTLKLAIEHTDITIHGANIMVLGFGRVGMTVARMFFSLGAHVHVCVRDASEAARIIEMGCTPTFINNIEREVRSIQVCINTIPSLVLNSSVISKMNKETLIIDLASKPGGTDFKFAEQQGIKTLWPLGLPGKVAPKTAGKILGDALIQLLELD